MDMAVGEFLKKQPQMDADGREWSFCETKPIWG
jgi:hypothetical protein